MEPEHFSKLDSPDLLSATPDPQQKPALLLGEQLLADLAAALLMHSAATGEAKSISGEYHLREAVITK